MTTQTTQLTVEIDTSNITAMTRGADSAEVSLLITLTPELADKLLVQCVEADKVAAYNATKRSDNGTAQEWYADMFDEVATK